MSDHINQFRLIPVAEPPIVHVGHVPNLDFETLLSRKGSLLVMHLQSKVCLLSSFEPFDYFKSISAIGQGVGDKNYELVSTRILLKMLPLVFT